jgi:hypothetical protein
MSRVLSSIPLAIAALTTMTACSGGDGGTPPSSSAAAESTQAPARAPASPAPADTPAESTPAAAGAPSEQDLAAILAGITAPDGAPLTVVPAGELASLTEQGLQALEGVTVTPAECNVFSESSLAMPEGAVYAVGVALSADGLTSTSVTLMSLDGAEDQARSKLEAARTLAGRCSTYQLEVQGVTVTAETTMVETTNEGAVSQGAVGLITLPTGQEQHTSSVSASRDTISVTVMNQTSDSPSASPAVLEQVVDEVLTAAQG